MGPRSLQNPLCGRSEAEIDDVKTNFLSTAMGAGFFLSSIQAIMIFPIPQPWGYGFFTSPSQVICIPPSHQPGGRVHCPQPRDKVFPYPHPWDRDFPQPGDRDFFCAPAMSHVKTNSLSPARGAGFSLSSSQWIGIFRTHQPWDCDFPYPPAKGFVIFPITVLPASG